VKRLDILMVEKGMFTGRDRAKEAIVSGRVTVNGQIVRKASALFDETAAIILSEAGSDFVSRGGNKLEHALQEFQIDVSGLTVLDVGAAAGGFTDCMLRRGAVRSYALDSGTGQLMESLRQDPRVINMEGVNIRAVTGSLFSPPPEFIAVDVSFISLSLVLPVLSALCREGTQVVCLVKPQFEAGRQNVGKKGVVKDAKVHESVLTSFLDCAAVNGFSVCGLTYSPIKGPEGNIEFLAHLVYGLAPGTQQTVKQLVKTAHEALKGH